MAATTPRAEPLDPGWRWENTYAGLPDVCFASARPASVAAPSLTLLNFRLAEELGLDLRGHQADATARMFSGQDLPTGCRPIAQAYAGHQYGHFTMLGDGRAILLGEHRTPRGNLVDIQLKGAGRTRFSRQGDGRAALGPMLREYVISEALFALGLPTTRSLAVVATGEPVYRTTVLPGAVLTRVAASHIRVGTFEYLAARREPEHLRRFADYTIARHDPDLAAAPEPYVAFLRAVIRRQASLIASWQLIGFIHGVMNTDNMAISGETIDYGPCAFMNVYRPETVFSSIDHTGRYAYGNQPAIGQWNLTRFAEALLPLLAPDPDQEQAVACALELLNDFPRIYEQFWLDGMRRKLGLTTAADDDQSLVQALLDWMSANRADFTNTFRDLSEGTLTDGRCQQPEFQAWQTQWHSRLSREGSPLAAAQARMQSVNPAVIPRNHQVEAALSAAESQGDLSVLKRLLAVLDSPFQADAAAAPYREPSPDDDRYQTFCGT